MILDSFLPVHKKKLTPKQLYYKAKLMITAVINLLSPQCRKVRMAGRTVARIIIMLYLRKTVQHAPFTVKINRLPMRGQSLSK